MHFWRFTGALILISLQKRQDVCKGFLTLSKCFNQLLAVIPKAFSIAFWVAVSAVSLAESEDHTFGKCVGG